MFLCLGMRLLVLFPCIVVGNSREQLVHLLSKLDTKGSTVTSLLQLDEQFQHTSGGGGGAPPPPTRRRVDKQNHGQACEETDFNDADDPDCYSRRYTLMTSSLLPRMHSVSESLYASIDQYNVASAIGANLPPLSAPNAALAAAVAASVNDLKFQSNSAIANVQSVLTESQSRLAAMEQQFTLAFATSSGALSAAVKNAQTGLSDKLVNSLNKLITHANSLNKDSDGHARHRHKVRHAKQPGAAALARSYANVVDSQIDKIESKSQVAFDSNIFQKTQAFANNVITAQSGALQTANNLAASLQSQNAQSVATMVSETQSLLAKTKSSIPGIVNARVAVWNSARANRGATINTLLTPVNQNIASFHNAISAAANTLDAAIQALATSTSTNLDGVSKAQIQKLNTMVTNSQTMISSADTWSAKSAVTLGKLRDKLTSVRGELVNSVSSNKKNGASSVASSALAAMAQVGRVQSAINAGMFAKQSHNLQALNELQAQLAKSGLNFETLLSSATNMRSTIESAAKAALNGNISVTDALMTKLNSAVQTRSLALAALVTDAANSFVKNASTTRDFLLKLINDEANKFPVPSNISAVVGNYSVGLEPSLIRNDMHAAGAAAEQAASAVKKLIAQSEKHNQDLFNMANGDVQRSEQSIQSQADKLESLLTNGSASWSVEAVNYASAKSAGAVLSNFILNLQADKSASQIASGYAEAILGDSASRAAELVAEAAQLEYDTNAALQADKLTNTAVNYSLEQVVLVDPDWLNTQLNRLDGPSVLQKVADLSNRLAQIPQTDLRTSETLAAIFQIQADWNQTLANWTSLLNMKLSEPPPVYNATPSLLEDEASLYRMATTTREIQNLQTGIPEYLSAIEANATANFTAFIFRMKSVLNNQSTASIKTTTYIPTIPPNLDNSVTMFEDSVHAAVDKLNDPATVAAVNTAMAQISGILASVLKTTSVGIDGLFNTSVADVQDSAVLLANQLRAMMKASNSGAALMNSSAVQALKYLEATANASISKDANAREVAAISAQIAQDSAASAMANLQASKARIASALTGALSTVANDPKLAIHDFNILKGFTGVEIGLTNIHSDAELGILERTQNELNKTVDLALSELLDQNTKMNHKALSTVANVGESIQRIATMGDDIDLSMANLSEDAMRLDAISMTEVEPLEIPNFLRSLSMNDSFIENVFENFTLNNNKTIDFVDSLIEKAASR